MKRLKHRVEYALFLVFYSLFRLLPLPAASAFGSILTRIVGPHMRAHRTALHNLAIAFPHESPAWHRNTAHAMWRNLGRVIGEYPHIRRPAMHKRLTIENPERILALLQQYPSLNFCGAHMANWEVFSLMADQLSKPVTLVYRRANNPYIDQFIRTRRTTNMVRFVPKGAEAARELLRAIRSREAIGMLVDQKMNQGRMIDFFGKPAPTPTTHAEMARRFNVPIVPMRCVRSHGTHFTLSFEDLILPEDKGSAEATELHMLTQWQTHLESWIRAHPDQWFWVHRRWPKEDYR